MKTFIISHILHNGKIFLKPLNDHRMVLEIQSSSLFVFEFFCNFLMLANFQPQLEYAVQEQKLHETRTTIVHRRETEKFLAFNLLN